MFHHNSVHFTSIKIEGYRGRNFELKMNPDGDNTVFIMDGNTGKTTTIELLRWCFKYPESKAKDEFRHMWTDNAHVLDFLKMGEEQTCTISINFKSTGQNYSFKRITKGKYIIDADKKIQEDRIEEIYDSLELDHGRSHYEHDDVFYHLSEKFKFDECVEYFCFDGEKARDVMMSSSDRGKINLLLETINKRITNPKLDEYERKLEELKKRIYSKSSSKLTDTSLKTSLNKIIIKEDESKRAEDDLQNNIDYLQILNTSKDSLKEDLKSIEYKIKKSNSEILIEKNRLENSIEKSREKIEHKRDEIYQEGLNWIKFETDNFINEIKKNVKETGKLPEPYREDLIKECLQGPIPTCQICGRELDEISIQRVKELEEMVATHEVHDFLSSELMTNTTNFNSSEKNIEIKDIIEKYENLLAKYNNIKLSDTDKKWIEKKDNLRKELGRIIGKISNAEQDYETIKKGTNLLKREITELRSKNDALKENRAILEKVDITLNIIKESKEKTKELAINVISDVISESVASILGDKFSATLTKEEGLLLGENDIFGTEIGGMSGRLILSYCFAESMTFIDPIIVDTPSGNIGSHRDALAKHLKANHKQVILLCLPTEIENFAPHISNKKFVEIKNEDR